MTETAAPLQRLTPACRPSARQLHPFDHKHTDTYLDNATWLYFSLYRYAAV
ncbi:hypothetical protein CZ787_00840 [Halomonas citrativorans]|uniref:Uncharacterized protein n=1 Tax=Halomonas citrativorans TaxID=2742612 RepID=A0A1R4HPP1_9GAMM|nr:hypothetical protein CZ787_00840 [Halomonas citrativorans]